MKITYIFHSGFLVEIGKVVLVFDYYKSDMPEVVKDKEKKIYFFASHTHSDHFNPKIFEFADENVKYIISNDIKEKIDHRKMLDNYPKVNLEYVRADESYEYKIDDSQTILIETLKSTDKGVAFMVSTLDKCIYHAGDLNEWLFDNMEKSKHNDMVARYEREINKIKGKEFDIAFLPVDYRLGEYKYSGPLKFLTNTKTKTVFPMHMWKRYSEIEMFREFINNKEIDSVVYDASKEGETVEI